MILSGGASNLYDRVINNGAVVDFLNIGFGSFRTGIFNIADIAIVVGALLLLLLGSKPETGR
ncbi:signal peptidase II [Vibrio chagasii]